jgi:hypothetical protein
MSQKSRYYVLERLPGHPDLVDVATPTRVVRRRGRLHNARHEQRGLTSVQRS